jgi:hypothetical protein
MTVLTERYREVDGPQFQTEYFVAPHYLDTRWRAENTRFQPNREILQLHEVPVSHTQNTPSLPAIRRYQNGETEWKDTLPPHRSAVSTTHQPVDPMRFIRISQVERSAWIQRMNLTDPIGIQSGINLMAIPSVELSQDGIPLSVSDVPEDERTVFFVQTGNGFTDYMNDHQDIQRATIGVTYGFWKSQIPMHFHMNMYTGDEMKNAEHVPLDQLDPDLIGLYKNNEIGILTACRFTEMLMLDMYIQLGIHPTGDKIFSSGAAFLEVDIPIGELLARYGARLWPYLEDIMIKSYSDARHCYTGAQQPMNHFCGAIVLSQENNRTFIHMAAGTRMDQTTVARGGLFTAQNIWSDRSGIATPKEAAIIKDNVLEFAEYLTQGRNINHAYDDVRQALRN